MPDDVHVGDIVNVPGGMYGTVKYLGAVSGKPGRFAGIELGSEHAQRGKNSGDVEGREYFKTSVPGSGIFVPMNNNKYVTRRTTSNFAVPTTPARAPPVNFSKSMGPTPSMHRPRVRRPSLPRPESPRVAPPKLGLGGLRTPSAASKASNAYPRSPIKPPSRLSDRPPSRFSLDDDTSSYGRRPSDVSQAPPNSGELQDLKEQIKILERRLLERDKQLNDQTKTLQEFQSTLEELEGSDALSIRAQLHERNERINQLTEEFDGHRADFRSTLDTLEIAASETERVYEQRLDELMQQNKELHDQGEDVEIVALQLKQLEDLVSELEEGLEDARRGEAEARAEVEFLRGEVERTKLELKKERDYSAVALRDAQDAADGDRNSHELDQKDDEIRGLKAIIHSLSRENSNATNPNENGHGSQNEHVVQLEQKLKEIEENNSAKETRIEELEHELQELRLNSSNGARNRSATVTSPSTHRNISVAQIKPLNAANHAHRLSDRTVVPTDWHDASSDPHDSRGASNSSQRLEPTPESDRSDEEALWCEVCEEGGHDILNCTSMFGSSNQPAVKIPEASFEETPTEAADEEYHSSDLHESTDDSFADATPLKTGRDVVIEGLKGIGSLGSSMAPIAGKSSGVIDETKWCALCERDGHESIDCPFDE